MITYSTKEAGQQKKTVGAGVGGDREVRGEIGQNLKKGG